MSIIKSFRARRREHDVEVLAGDEAIANAKLRHMVGQRPALDVACFRRDSSHFVYMLWEDADRPVYVGSSPNVLAQLGEHLGDPDRGHRLAWVTLVRCESADDATLLAARLIDHYQPEVNLLERQ